MKMTLFGLPRMVVSVLALALLSMGQSIASSPLYLQSWTFSPDGPGNPTGLQLTAAGGVPPYTYNVVNALGTYNETNTTGTFTFPVPFQTNAFYGYTITDSATPANVINGPYQDTSIYINIVTSRFGSGSEITTMITPACAGGSTGSIQTITMGLTGTDNVIVAMTPGTTEAGPGTNLTQTLNSVEPTSGAPGYNIRVGNQVTGDEVQLYFDFPTALSAIAVTATPTNPNCTGSDILVTATGGTAAYTTAVATGTGGMFTANFSGTSKTTTITNVPAGTYTVTVTDNNTFPGGPTPCSGSVTGVTVPSPAAASSLYLAGFSVSCSGTPTVTFIAGGGVPPYTYTYTGQPNQTQSLGTPASFSLVSVGNYTITDSAAVPNSISGSYSSNECSGNFSVCFGPTILFATSNFASKVSLQSQPGECTSANTTGCLFTNLMPGTKDVFFIAAKSALEFNSLSFTTPAIAPVCFTAVPGCGSITITGTGGSGLYNVTVNGTLYPNVSQPLVLTGLAAGMYV